LFVNIDLDPIYIGSKHAKCVFGTIYKNCQYKCFIFILIGSPAKTFAYVSMLTSDDKLKKCKYSQKKVSQKKVLFTALNLHYVY